MTELYHDYWITCTDDLVTIKGYYFPWGTKRIAYSKIRDIERVPMGNFTGKGRIWGTANPRYWGSLDPRRSRKEAALIINTGHWVKPYITPDDPDKVEAIIREKAGLGPAPAPATRGPVV